MQIPAEPIAGGWLLCAAVLPEAAMTVTIPRMRTSPRAADRTARPDRWLAAACFALGAGIAATALLGPLWTNIIRYPVPATALNQQVGSDVFALCAIVPLAVAAGVLALRGHHLAPVLAPAPAGFALYIFVEEILAPDYVRLPGNSQRFVPLFLAVFILGGVVAVRSWARLPRAPHASRRTAHVLGWVLLAFALFMVVGRYLPALADAMRARPTNPEYLAAPTLFWTIAFEDLGVVLPVAVVVGYGLLRERDWAGRPAYLLFAWLAVVPACVGAMAIAMLVRHDPNASAASAVLLSTIGLAATLPALGYARSTARRYGRSWEPVQR